MKGEEGMEKLIEEIKNEYLERFWRLGRGGMVIDKTWTRTTILALIARIGKAYADGELELPGEIGRSPVIGKDDEGIWVEKHLRRKLVFRDFVIALRREEAIPKELLSEITKGQRP